MDDLRSTVASVLEDPSGEDLLSFPNRFLSYVADIADPESREVRVLMSCCDDNLLRPYVAAIPDAKEQHGFAPLAGAAKAARRYLHDDCIIDDEAARDVADAIALGIADHLGIDTAQCPERVAPTPAPAPIPQPSSPEPAPIPQHSSPAPAQIPQPSIPAPAPIPQPLTPEPMPMPQPSSPEPAPPLPQQETGTSSDSNMFGAFADTQDSVNPKHETVEARQTDKKSSSTNQASGAIPLVILLALCIAAAVFVFIQNQSGNKVSTVPTQDAEAAVGSDDKSDEASSAPTQDEDAAAESDDEKEASPAPTQDEGAAVESDDDSDESESKTPEPEPVADEEDAADTASEPEENESSLDSPYVDDDATWWGGKTDTDCTFIYVENANTQIAGFCALQGGIRWCSGPYEFDGQTVTIHIDEDKDYSFRITSRYDYSMTVETDDYGSGTLSALSSEQIQTIRDSLDKINRA